MKRRKQQTVGIVGSLLTAICCFTPVLAILMGAIGLSSLLGWLDYILLPLLVIFIGILGHSLWRLRSN
ncbi:mercury resistance system transport protein MerF [Sneathiella glossodoripedis]|uniref:mercury resistance system transport protein MerF n=1 Tax=Sneathiella glossodoripedis TaxID=418853 RepID=UPI0004720F01|nr:mercury resistance system transport protein MerF [Sneathiella glossodoripedis]